MMKRLLSLALAVILTVTALPYIVLGTEAAVSYETQYNELLTKLSIYLPSDIDMYDSGYYINRGYFAVILKRLANSDKTYSEAQLRDILDFSDVNPSGEIAESIAFCIENGYMNGVDNYKFEPKKRITLEQAIKPLVILLGRQRVAEEKGGYPFGYTYAAKSIDLLDSISDGMGDILNRTTVTQLLYNALMCEYLELYKIAEEQDDVYVYEKGNGKTYMREVFDVTLISGVVEGNENTMLDVNDKTADEGCIIVDDTTVKGENLWQYLGYYVNCYARVDEKNNSYENVYTAVGTTENKIMTIKAEDIKSFKDGTYTYYNKDGKQREVRLSADADVIFNGKAMPNYTDAHMVPNSGYVTLIDNGSSWNVVLVTYYNTAVVGYVDAKNEKVMLMDNAGVLEYGKADNIYIELDGNGISGSELAEWDVLSIAADVMADTTTGRLDIANSKIFNIRVNRGGVFTSPLTAIEEETVMFSGHRYEFSESLMRNKPTLKLGTSYKGALDIDGRLAYLEGEKNGGSYAILTRIATKGLWDKTAMLRMFTADGEWKIYETADKIKIDGQYVEAGDVETILNKTPYIAASTGKFEPRLVNYSLNNELKIKSIDTSVRGTEENDMTMSEPLIMTGSYDGAYYMGWFQNGVLFEQKIATFFNVPTVKGVIDPSLESAFSIGAKIVTSNTYCRTATLADDGFDGYKEAIYAYDIDELKKSELFLHTREYTSGMQKSDLNNMIVVDTVLERVMEDGTVATVINGYNVRSSNAYPRNFEGYLTDDVVIEDNCPVGKIADMTVSDIRKGDFLRIIVNDVGGKKEITAILREFSPANKEACNPDLYGDICISSKNGSNFDTRTNAAASSLQFGWAYSVDDTFLTLTNVRDAKTVDPSDPKALYGFFQDKTSKPFVLTYDRERDKLTVSEDFTTIPTWKSVGDTSQMPLCLCYSSLNFLNMALIIE